MKHNTRVFESRSLTVHTLKLWFAFAQLFCVIDRDATYSIIDATVSVVFLKSAKLARKERSKFLRRMRQR